MKKYILALTILCLSIGASAQIKDDKKLVEKAIMNYVDAFYQADTSKAYESIAKVLAKRGYYTDKDGMQREATMSFDQLISLAKRWKSSQDASTLTLKKITVFEVLDKIAVGKLEAKWGIDYFHLAKINGKWIIINVLWQDHPKN